MTEEEHDAYYAGQEDGEVGYKSPQLKGESDAVYAFYLKGLRDGQMRARNDERCDPGSYAFWDEGNGIGGDNREADY